MGACLFGKCSMGEMTHDPSFWNQMAGEVEEDGEGFDCDLMAHWGDFGAKDAAKTVQKDLDDFDGALYGEKTPPPLSD